MNNIIGVLFCGYNTIEYVSKSLASWQQAQSDKLFNSNWLISAVSLPFDKYKDMVVEKDATQDFLRQEYNSHRIDYLATEPEYVGEATARNLALKPLLEAKCDLILCWDSDEVATIEQIQKMLEFVEVNRFESWFSISYKNYVFSKSQYLEEPFTPPRIFRVHTNGYEIDKFVWDNDIQYKRELVFSASPLPLTVSYKELPNKIIPPNVCFVPHYSWLNVKSSKDKCEYQQKHFGHSGYRWDEKDGLKFNEEFYLTRGLMLPRVVSET